MQVNRERFLRNLEMLRAGLDSESNVVFKDGRMIAAGEEAVVSAPAKLKGFTGAIRAKPLIEQLQRWKEEDIELIPSETELLVKGKNQRCAIAVEKEGQLPVDGLEEPGDFAKLPEGFGEAISLVQACAGKDETEPATVSVHLCPEWVEAFDNVQAGRRKIHTGIAEPFLTRRDSIKHVSNLDSTEIAVGKNWVHFRNPSGVILSCRRMIDEYPDLGPLFKVQGERVALPKGLAEAADRAEVFSAENGVEGNMVQVSLEPGKLSIRGQGVSGWYSARRKIEYEGKAFAFLISPKLLVEIVRKHDEVILGKSSLLVNGGDFKYVAWLAKPSSKEE